MIYISIFISKILENSLSTLRIILVSNGKKKLGALLQGFVMLVWILVTGYIITNINNDIKKIIIFCLGSICGSYLGSILEEKIALGNIKLTIKTNKKKEIYKLLKIYNCTYNNNLIYLFIKRNKIDTIRKKINKIDSEAVIIGEKIKIYGK